MQDFTPSCWKLEESCESQDFIRCFKNDIFDLETGSLEIKENLSKKSNNDEEETLKITTWNIHSWSSFEGNFNIENTLNTLKTLNSDILFLQEAWIPHHNLKAMITDSQQKEVTITILQNKLEDIGYDVNFNNIINPEESKNQFKNLNLINNENNNNENNNNENNNNENNNNENNNENKFEDIKKFLNFFPTMEDLWDGVFGNMICIKKNSKIKLLKNSRVHLKLPRDQISEERCAAGITILFNQKELQIWNCHLDVYDHSEKLREKQIKMIESFSQEKPTLILGDLNSVQKSIYSEDEWINLVRLAKKGNVDWEGKIPTLCTDFLKEQKWKTCWEISSTKSPKFSCLYGRVVDFVFLNESFEKKWKLKKPFLFPNGASDHFPITFEIS